MKGQVSVKHDSYDSFVNSSVSLNIILNPTLFLNTKQSHVSVCLTPREDYTLQTHVYIKPQAYFTIERLNLFTTNKQKYIYILHKENVYDRLVYWTVTIVKNVTFFSPKLIDCNEKNRIQ